MTGLTGFVMGGLGEVTSWDVVMADSRVSERSITPPPWGSEIRNVFFVHYLINFITFSTCQGRVGGSSRGVHEGPFLGFMK